MSYDNTISGLLRRREELFKELVRLREDTAAVGNTIASVDHVLRSMGFEGLLDEEAPRTSRIVYFARNELRRFLIEELRKANGEPITSRDAAEKIMQLEGKNPRDRRMRNDMVKRVGKSFKLLRAQGMAESRGKAGSMVWVLAKELVRPRV